jgi:hypothetical protein
MQTRDHSINTELSQLVLATTQPTIGSSGADWEVLQLLCGEHAMIGLVRH